MALPAPPLPDTDFPMVPMSQQYRSANMSFGTSSSSNTSMLSPPDPMDDAPVLPFSGLPGAQFSDLATRVLPSSRRFSFRGFRDSRIPEPEVSPVAPRYVDEYGRPFIQWPPARQSSTSHTLPPAQGTFERLRISDQEPLLYGPSAPPALVHRPQPPSGSSSSALLPYALAPSGRSAAPAHPAYPALQYLPAASVAPPSQAYAIVPIPPASPPEIPIPPGMERYPSIDAVQINAVRTEPTQVRVRRSIPPALNVFQKIQAIMGNERLLAQHHRRQQLKRIRDSSF